MQRMLPSLLKTTLTPRRLWLTRNLKEELHLKYIVLKKIILGTYLHFKVRG